MVQVFQNFQAFDNNVIVDFEVAHLKLWVVFLTRIKNMIFFSLTFPFMLCLSNIGCNLKELFIYFNF